MKRLLISIAVILTFLGSFGLVHALSVFQFIQGGTGATSFANNSIVTSNSGGTALIATGTQLTVGNLLATTSNPSTFTGGLLSMASTTIGANATTTGSFGAKAIYVNGDYITDFTGTGLTLSGNALTNSGVISVSCTTITCSGTSPAAFSIGANAISYSQLVQLAANSVLGNSTGATANVGTVATSTFFGVNTDGRILAQLNGTINWVATTTFNSPLTYSAGSVSCSTCNTSNASVSSVATNNGLTGGTITTSGTIGLASIAANNVLANGTGASGVPSAVATSTFFGVGTDGQILAQTGGTIHWVSTTTAGTGLTYTTGSPGNFSVNTSQNISTLSNLVNNGFVQTTGGTGALSIQQFPVTVAEGGTNKTTYPINSIITSDSAGTSLIATTSQLTVGSILSTSTVSNSVFLNNWSAFGTSTNPLSGVVVIASSTKPQLVFSVGANVNMWALRALPNGDLAFATTTAVGTATTSTSALVLQTSGVPSVTVGTTTCMTTLKNGSLCLGGGGDAQGNTGSTTISASKLQFDITDRLGARTCAFFNGTAIVVVAGACTP